MTGSPDKASIFYIKVDDPANEQAVIDAIHMSARPGRLPGATMREWLSMMTPEKLPGFNVALNIVTGIAVIVGFLVIFQSMYTAVLERTREIGILKSMGASKLGIMGVVLRETAVLAVGGVLLGIAGTFGVRVLLYHVFPDAAFRNHYALDWAGRRDCICGIAAGRALPGVDGVAQGSHRRAGVRVRLKACGHCFGESRKGNRSGQRQRVSGPFSRPATDERISCLMFFGE